MDVGSRGLSTVFLYWTKFIVANIFNGEGGHWEGNKHCAVAHLCSKTCQGESIPLHSGNITWCCGREQKLLTAKVHKCEQNRNVRQSKSLKPDGVNRGGYDMRGRIVGTIIIDTCAVAVPKTRTKFKESRSTRNLAARVGFFTVKAVCAHVQNWQCVAGPQSRSILNELEKTQTYHADRTK